MFVCARMCMGERLTWSGAASLSDHATFVLTATRQHAFNLGKFVFIYKTLLLLQRRLDANGKERDFHAFVAGWLGGYLVFGEYNNINYQVRPTQPLSACSTCERALVRLCLGA
jgi:hypothetical protein